MVSERKPMKYTQPIKKRNVAAYKIAIIFI